MTASSERLKSPRARLFIALDLPDGAREALADWQREALQGPVLRPVAAEALHVTLAFLGYRPERQIERLAAAMQEVLPGSREAALAPQVRLGEVVPRPNGRRPRLLAIGIDSDAAIALQGVLAGELAARGLYKEEKRRFWPHLTVARLRRKAVAERGGGGIELPSKPLPAGLRSPIECVRVTLYRSKLQPQGAQYAPLAQVELSRGGRQ